MLGKKKKLHLPRFFGSHHHTNLLRPCATSTSSQQIANPNHLNRSNLSLYRFPFSVINQSCLFVDKHDPEALVLHYYHQPLVRLPIGSLLVRLPIGSLLVYHRPLFARLLTGSLLAIGARGEGGQRLDLEVLDGGYVLKIKSGIVQRISVSWRQHVAKRDGIYTIEHRRDR